jgi:hypothetical protein
VQVASFSYAYPNYDYPKPQTWLSLSWSAPSYTVGLSGYNVYRSTANNYSYGTPTFVAAGTTSYLDTSCVKGTTYYYKVVALYGGWGDTGGYVDESHAATCSIDPPASAPASSSALSRINYWELGWTAVSGATRYEVWRHDDSMVPGVYQLLDANVAGTGYNDYDKADTNIIWHIYAANDGGRSASYKSQP